MKIKSADTRGQTPYYSILSHTIQGKEPSSAEGSFPCMVVSLAQSRDGWQMNHTTLYYHINLETALKLVLKPLDPVWIKWYTTTVPDEVTKRKET